MPEQSPHRFDTLPATDLASTELRSVTFALTREGVVPEIGVGADAELTNLFQDEIERPLRSIASVLPTTGHFRVDAALPSTEIDLELSTIVPELLRRAAASPRTWQQAATPHPFAIVYLTDDLPSVTTDGRLPALEGVLLPPTFPSPVDDLDDDNRRNPERAIDAGVLPTSRLLALIESDEELRRQVVSLLDDPALREVVAGSIALDGLTESADPNQPVPTLSAARDMLSRLRSALGAKLSRLFNRFEGFRDDDLGTCVEIASLMDEIAASLDLSFRFTDKQGEEILGRLRCGPSGRRRLPSFRFECKGEKRQTTRNSSRALPESDLRPSPPDPRRGRRNR